MHTTSQISEAHNKPNFGGAREGAGFFDERTDFGRPRKRIIKAAASSLGSGA